MALCRDINTSQGNTNAGPLSGWDINWPRLLCQTTVNRCLTTLHDDCSFIHSVTCRDKEVRDDLENAGWPAGCYYLWSWHARVGRSTSLKGSMDRICTTLTISLGTCAQRRYRMYRESQLAKRIMGNKDGRMGGADKSPLTSSFSMSKASVMYWI